MRELWAIESRTKPPWEPTLEIYFTKKGALNRAASLNKRSIASGWGIEYQATRYIPEEEK